MVGRKVVIWTRDRGARRGTAAGHDVRKERELRLKDDTASKTHPIRRRRGKQQGTEHGGVGAPAEEGSTGTSSAHGGRDST